MQVLKLEEGKFVEGQGYWYGEALIADFELFIARKKVLRDPSSTAEIISYVIGVKSLDGIKSELVETDNLEQIWSQRSIRTLFSAVSNSVKCFFVEKLKQEALKIKGDSVVKAPGYYEFSEGKMLVIGDEVFGCPSNSSIEPLSSYCWDKSVPYDQDFINRFISFIPGVTEPLFYAALSAVIVPILDYLGVVNGFVTAIVAPSGHLKTSLAQLYTHWNVENEIGVIFDEIKTKKLLNDEIIRASGFCFLLDDYHTMVMPYEQRKHQSFLDYVSRLSTKPGMGTRIILTAERIEGENIFSGYDRVFEICIPSMTEEALATLKSNISKLKSCQMASIANQFAKKVSEDFSKVESDILSFVEQYQSPDWVDNSTRVGNHIMTIMLTEYLFRKYVCEGLEEVSSYRNLINALEKNGKKQTNKLLKLRKKEQPEMILLELYNLIKNQDDALQVKMNKKLYDYNKHEAYYDVRCNLYCITSENLVYIMTRRLKRAVGILEISRHLHEYCLLVEDSDSWQGKTKKKRHYKISVEMLENICRYIHEDEDVDV